MEDLEAFARLITALRPWLGQLIVVGGWAHRLHRFHPLASVPAHSALRTLDADVAFSKDAALAGDIRAALSAAGFNQELFGEDTPPATHYRLGSETAGFYAEFLTPLLGEGLKRTGKPDATLSRAGITAQKLRYLDLLLISPWGIRVGRKQGVPVTAGAHVLVPNPTSFIVQKLLIHSERRGSKKAQDLLYIHDTLELFGGSLEKLRASWVDEVRPAISKAWAKRAATIARDLFAHVTDTIREAARIPQDRHLTPESVHHACQHGLGEILGIHEPPS